MPKPFGGSVIRLRGVRQNNLKNFDLDLPLRSLIVITGLSGSGKSSLAFDTLFAEGQRRYIETFSPYARQFFDRMDKPQVDSVEGIPPAIAIEQRNTVRTTRSTVGTMTEICDYMKVLWPCIAQLHCRSCGQPVRKDSPQSIWETVTKTASRNRSAGQDKTNSRPEIEKPRAPSAEPPTEVLVTFDLPLSEKLSLADSLALIAKQGYQRLLLGAEIVRIDEAAARLGSVRPRPTTLTVIQDRLRLTPENRARFIEACEQAYHFGKGKLTIHINPSTIKQFNDSTVQRSNGLTLRFSNALHCAECDIEYREPSPALFSFNHPLGACPTCKGFGRIITIDYNLAIPDRSLSLAEGAIKPWRSGFSAECQQDLLKFCKARGVPVNVPFAKLKPEHQRWVIEGDEDYGIDDAHEWPYAWYGLKGYFRWLESKAYKMHVRVLLSRYRAYTTCPDCNGARLKPDALLYLLAIDDLPSAVAPPRKRNYGPDATVPTPKIANRQLPIRLTLADFYALPIRDALELINALANKFARTGRTGTTPASPSTAIEVVLEEVRARLKYLVEVGLGYLTLDRPTRTLSGGETERVNLTTCLGTRLVNTLFVLDEPSVGLHPRDTDRLVRILQQLRDAGNTVVVVEHEPGVIRAADRIIDLGPGSGEAGGRVVFQGSFGELLADEHSLTGMYLSGRRRIEIPHRRPVTRLTSKIQTSEQKLPHVIQNKKPPQTQHSAQSRLAETPMDWLTIRNATKHNLKNLTVQIPLRRFVCVTGVSGSGKSTLVRDVLYPALVARLGLEIENQKASDRLDTPAVAEPETECTRELHNHTTAEIEGWEHLGRVVLVDQSSLGKTPRSNPAVYIGAFDHIRELFAQTDAARQRGLGTSAFSFNSAQGQCERCRGAGFEKVEMQFLSDVFIRCPECNGRRYRNHILEIKIQAKTPPVNHLHAAKNVARRWHIPQTRPSHSEGDLQPRTLSWSIADLLDATVDEAVVFLSSLADSKPAQRALAMLKLLQEVGLGYLRLGQPINTLSGGESQRLKLVRHLAEFAAACDRCSSNHTGIHSPPQNQSILFLFDEPTTGLHFDDIRQLVKVFQRLVDAGHSLIVIEHNIELIKCADWVIDLGPEAGDQGGTIVVEGTPEDIAACPESHTGRALRAVLGNHM